jgi:hypothetical protein
MFSPDVESLCKIEPRLSDLFAKAKTIKDNRATPSFCANHLWYGCAGCLTCKGGLKEELQRLVGINARNPHLHSNQTYAFAYGALYAALPPCRNCACL